jgi:hypothetical protein
MKKLCVKIIAIFALLLTILGVIGFLSGFAVSLGGLHRIIPDSFEMPLGDLQGIAVDSEGNIYCGVQFYSRIQAYDINGRFLYGKCFDSHGGAFKIKINSNEQLEVATYRGRNKYIFSKEGSLLYRRSNDPSCLLGFERINNFSCYDQKRDLTYQINPILLPPVILANATLISPFGSHVVKKDISGKETVIIQTPFYKWLFMGPFPGFLFMFIGGLLYSIVLGKKVKLLFWTINKDDRDVNSLKDLRVDRF